MSAQGRDLKLAAEIEENLQYYDFLDPASRRLNAPGAGNTVRGTDFSDMLRRLDECLDYMETHVREDLIVAFDWKKGSVLILLLAPTKGSRSISLEI